MTRPTTPSGGAAFRGTLLGVLVLAAVLAATVVLSLALGGDHPRLGEAVAFAAAVAGGGGLAGWLAARWPAADPVTIVAGGMGATALRLGPPLVGLLWLSGPGETLREAGAGGFLMGFFLALLATAILLNIMVGPPVPARRKGGGD